MNAVNEYGQKVQLSFNNLKTDGSSELASFEERVGSQKLSLDKLTIAIENKEMAVLDGMNINAKSEVAADKKPLTAS